MAKSFHELSSRAQTLVFFLLAGLTMVGAWQMLIGPAQGELSSQRAKLAAIQGDVARAQATAAKLPMLQKEVAESEAALQQTTAILPDEKDPQDVLRNLHDLASDAALDIETFTPKTIVTRTQYSEWPITLGLQGTYHNLGRFFDRIASMTRLMSVTDLQIKAIPKAGPQGTVTATCVATTFVFKKDMGPDDKAAAAQPAAQPQGTGGKK
ncbi:MAG TPA: type 4a pilus biogenesis protein PilO [Vicinamibacterales bacterium]|nr:type 4a pilus biogenesis protein PilO [Vicinamibacterales bacterium]